MFYLTLQFDSASVMKSNIGCYMDKCNFNLDGSMLIKTQCKLLQKIKGTVPHFLP